jgi:phage tail sheath protein FI
VTLPQIKARLGESRPTTSLPGDTGTAFIVGEADRGRVDAPVLIRSLAEYVDNFGPRVTYGWLYDELDVAFNEGLDHAYVVRTVGPAAVTASKNLVNSSSENTLEGKAVSPGAWANKVEVAVVAGVTEGTFHIHVSYGGTLEESSPELADNAAAVAWAAANSSYVRLKDLGKGDPKVQTVTLASGADDREHVTTAVIEEALEKFTPDLGPGQVAVPGNSAEAVQLAVAAHCEATMRVPVLDPEDTGNPETLIANCGALRGAAGAKQGAIFGPWDIAPGIALGTTRTVPPSARQLGAMARVDATTGSPDNAAAGDLGKARYVIGLSQTFSDSDREALNDAGFNVSIIDEGVPTTFGWRTLADPVNERGWLPLSTARLMVGLGAGAKKVLKRSLFKKLDAGKHTVFKAQGDIENEVIKPAYEAEALYGATEAEAAQVTVTQQVNPTNGAIGSLTATLVAIPTEFDEDIELVVVETNQSL